MGAADHRINEHMTRRFDVYAPLQDFYWSGRDFAFPPNLALKRMDDIPDLSGLESFVSKPEWKHATSSDHWLTCQWVDGTETSPSEIINLFLIIRGQTTVNYQMDQKTWSAPITPVGERNAVCLYLNHPPPFFRLMRKQ